MRHKDMHQKNCTAEPFPMCVYARHLSLIAALSCCALLPLAESARGEMPQPPSVEIAEDKTAAPAQPGKTPGLSAHANEIVDDPDIAVNTEIHDGAAAAEKDTPAAEAGDRAEDKAAVKHKDSEKQQDSEKQKNSEPHQKADRAKGKPKSASSAMKPAQRADNHSQAVADTAINVEVADPYPGKEHAIDFSSAGNALREQAARYRALTNHWQAIAPGAPLKPGDRGPRVAQLRKLLQQYGDYTGQPGPLAEGEDDHQRFDAGLQLALESYQRRHGMEVTGRADKPTLKELARPPQELARLLELNAERWDKLPTAPGSRYIFVNVPDYQLQLIDQRKVVLSMKTVVGKSSKRTPEMITSVVSVVFNPTWTVPRSILLTDLLPKARNNPEAMHKRGYRVVKYGTNTTTPISEQSIESAASGKATLRQISGPGNTLGRVKFVIPNKQAIFLHDTQAQSLFEHRHRAFSHGCIRLQQPEELAYALLGAQGWDRTQVAQATTGDESLTIKVENPPKLFITYLTAWVDVLGRVQFRPDIYHRDK